MPKLSVRKHAKMAGTNNRFRNNQFQNSRNQKKGAKTADTRNRFSNSHCQNSRKQTKSAKIVSGKKKWQPKKTSAKAMSTGKRC